MLTNSIILRLQQRKNCLNQIIFMLDGAPPHTDVKLQQLLRRHYFTGRRVVGICFTAACPPGSPDLTTLLKVYRLLNAKGYIVRRDTASGGGGLMFIHDVHFQRLPVIGNDISDLEYLVITVLSKDRTITIKNLYHPPNNQHLDTNMMAGLFDDNTIILGDFNAKNTTWGSTITNARDLELSNLVNEKAFLCLNDGTHTFQSNSYDCSDVLDLTFISPGLFPYSSWRVLDNIGSDHLPILVETDLKVNCTGVKNLHWNFKKADWSLFENISNNVISQEPLSDNLEKEWSHFKHSIFAAAKSSIPRGEIKRSNWQNLCEKLNYRTSNTKLWKLAKQIDNLKPSNEETNVIISDNGHVSVDTREVAEALAQNYANESRLVFRSSEKHLARVTRNQRESCRDTPADNPLFNVDYTLPELSYPPQNLDTNKSPGPDSIPEHFLSHLGICGKERLLYICNLSWKTGKLPRQWKSAIVILIHKPNKNAGLTTSCSPISLTCIT
ncbi:RNA-directed DNA polymerase from mobile element jockey [Trichonephila inaurata madagascariensis]|uniref:RNA-directed DNA polymerase from mobile element jockey n=1 Tax=Trichonephila inaurata madagascariensis TaxID=2747483 RepID=A0A8X7CCV2_9ARAC|nr:RNA-directed DNA polymerase from mobile element jockey [Trichonephila inaurata madagascariensis]